MKKLTYFIALVVMSSCSHQALVPYEYNAKIDRDPVSVIEANGLTVYMENIERKSNLLVFDLEVANERERPVKLSHPELYYYAGEEKFHDIHDTVTMDLKNAYAVADQKINHRKAMSAKRVEQYYENRASNKKAMGIFLFALGVGLVVNDIVKDSEDAQKAIWTENDQDRAASRDILTASTLLAIDIVGNETAREEARNYEDLHYLPFEMFPEKNIQPGQSFRGKVFFPLNQAHKYYRFVIPLGNTDYVFDFRKRKGEDKKKLRGHKVRR